uniref:Thioredoxin domain-containing protein n=1 Tax=Strombidium inclinatum TaxID=197538 RepID=A0A7S3MY22_9SPIT|mmetsp:Transcript_35605/g.54444  ORF Transcript_35605/g.54444 Transcript_35605/m.54444 type:complete len:183 (+) Transcript_35605:1-549(+)|eukprot:CAMPEP_0170494068 /NCGR_PEP_ID=MMETSP0208-20121228/14428_1 /TAXON_ID=197538 /ORGANISM="Strombidium inclinatum, Strain S3" /LENGTH=182 /DNA_ID=CAMNT_0010770067 /DNA_START=1 /DNA_END=549 /DNA_ORIENTATION=+
MKFTSIAILALIGTASAVTSLKQIEAVAPKDSTPPVESSLLACSTSEAEGEQGWKQGLPGLYDNTPVKSIEGQSAVELLNRDTLFFNKPEFVVAYHPQCPHCTNMVQDYVKLATLVKEKDLDVNIMAINMSKSWDQSEQLKVNAFPTIRLFKEGHQVIEYEGHHNYEGFVQFLKKNGISFDS